jgi:predicted DNA-binding transcriptional regulator YafY
MRYVLIDYVNYRGERSERLVEPAQIYFGSNEWHPEPQWLMDAWDHQKQAYRTFAMKDIHSWNPEYPT